MTDRAKNPLEDAAQPILDVQHRWVDALVKADTTALDRILVDLYVDTDESGIRLDKAGILAALKSGDLKLASITLLHTRVAQVWQVCSIDRFFRANRNVPGSIHCLEHTFHCHSGFAAR